MYLSQVATCLEFKVLRTIIISQKNLQSDYYYKEHNCYTGTEKITTVKKTQIIGIGTQIKSGERVSISGKLDV